MVEVNQMMIRIGELQKEGSGQEETESMLEGTPDPTGDLNYQKGFTNMEERSL